LSQAVIDVSEFAEDAGDPVNADHAAEMVASDVAGVDVVRRQPVRHRAAFR
jgi:hypothetical protein